MVEKDTSPEALEALAKSRKWPADVDHLKCWESDRILAMIGKRADQMKGHLFSFSAAAAVLRAQQEDETIPDEVWRYITIDDLELADPIDIEDTANPT